MDIEIKFINNTEQLFWIIDTKISNKNNGRIYYSLISDIGCGRSVAVYECNNNGKKQIAQLIYPDYSALKEKYNSGDNINLNYTYIDDFSWLGDEAPYEIENNPYKKISSFTASCSFWNNKSKEENDKYINIMQAEIMENDINFDYAFFNNVNLCFTNLKISKGNLIFNNSRLHDTEILILNMECAGNLYFSPEISFNYIFSENTHIEVFMLKSKLSVSFLLAKMHDSKVCIDGYPDGFNNVCFVKTYIKELIFTNANINSLDIRESNINTITFTRCLFNGVSQIESVVEKILIENSVISSIFKINISEIKELGFDNTVNIGKIYFSNFDKCITALMNHIIRLTESEQNQMLMLKENFRQLGEFSNEDYCHLQYQKLKTKNEKNIFKKMVCIAQYLISGYGTKPLNMLLFIMIMILGFALIFDFVSTIQFSGASTFSDYVYISGITFFTVGYGDILPLNKLTKIVSIIEAFCGVASMSYFIVVLSRKIIR